MKYLNYEYAQYCFPKSYYVFFFWQTEVGGEEGRWQEAKQRSVGSPKQVLAHMVQPYP